MTCLWFNGVVTKVNNRELGDLFVPTNCPNFFVTLICAGLKGRIRYQEGFGLLTL